MLTNVMTNVMTDTQSAPAQCAQPAQSAAHSRRLPLHPPAPAVLQVLGTRTRVLGSRCITYSCCKAVKLLEDLRKYL